MRRRRFLRWSCTGLTAGCLSNTGDDDGGNATDENASTASGVYRRPRPGAGDTGPAEHPRETAYPTEYPLPPPVEDRPRTPYIPTHRFGHAVVDVAEDGPLRCGLVYSYPLRYWTALGKEGCHIPVLPDDSVHLEIAFWDAETGTVLSDVGPIGKITRDGVLFRDLHRVLRGGRDPPAEPLHEPHPKPKRKSAAIYPMIDQTMGFHYGQTLEFREDGRYEVTLETAGIPDDNTGRIDKPVAPISPESGCQGRTIGPMGVRRFGAFEGRFEEDRRFDLTFDFAVSDRDELAFEALDHAGRPDSLHPHRDFPFPLAFAPEVSETPGRVVGRRRRHGVEYVAVVVPPGRGYGDEKSYLALSARMARNRFVLHRMTVSGELRRNGRVLASGLLHRGLSPDLDYHYGRRVEERSIDRADRLDVRIERPPHIARHEGYETILTRPTTIRIPL